MHKQGGSMNLKNMKRIILKAIKKAYGEEA